MKLEYYGVAKENLKSGKLTKDCAHYVQSEIDKAIDNIIYYREILDILEE